MRHDIGWRWRLIGACLSGLLLGLAFPWWNLWILAWIGLIPLLWSLRHRQAREAALLGWAAGGLHYLLLLYWLVPTMRSYGGLPTVLGIGVLCLLCLYLGAYWALFSYALAKIRAALGVHPLLFAPPLWCALEALRGLFMTGFPWALAGGSQGQLTALIQISDITGVYGVSFLILWINCALFALLEHILDPQDTGAGWAIAGLVAGAVMIAASLIYGAGRIAQVTSLSDGAERVSIGIAQGNIDQGRKWDPAFQDETLRIYETLTAELSAKKAALVVWPETAAPFFFQDPGPMQRRIFRLARKARVEILFGSPGYGRTGAKTAYYNRAYLVAPDGRVLGHYDKRHLVPFGEYVPFKEILFFINRMVQSIGDLTPGPEARPLPMGTGASIGVSICFESLFPEISRALVRKGADLLCNLTNDAWYGDTAGPYQHLAFLTFRAVETRRWIVRSANTGISAFIDPCGRVVSRLPLMRSGALVDTVSLIRLNSWYTAHGDRFAQSCSLWGSGLFVFALALSLSRKRRSHALS